MGLYWTGGLMPRHIVCIEEDDTRREWWLEWSTVVDAPVTYGMSETEFRGYYRQEYGINALDVLDARMQRARETGTSSRQHSLDSLLAGNKAGPHEEKLTREGILASFCFDPPRFV